MTLERFAVTTRSEITRDGKKLYGHASVFDQVADLGSHFEVIADTAFKRALDDPATDVRALFNHDPSQLLGRQKSESLRLSVDSQGLEFEVDLPDTQLGRDVKVLAERGDIDGASFGFIPDEDEWSEFRGRRLRRHKAVGALVDVSPVTFPAYQGASIMMRSKQSVVAVESQKSQLVRARARVLFGGGQ